MKVETKFEIEDKVFFINNNQVLEGSISSITIHIFTTISQKYSIYGQSNLYTEDKLFKTKEELLKSL